MHIINIQPKIFSTVFTTAALWLIFNSQVLATVSGDANRDGIVDITDYSIWYKEFFDQKGLSSDFNQSGNVNSVDFEIWRKSYLDDTPTRIPTTSITSAPRIPTTSVTSAPSSGISCNSLSGIERKFPCSPLSVGSMPEQITSGADAWDMFKNILYPGSPNGINERFSAVANPVGSGVVIRNQNLLSDSENHTTVGTGRSLPYGSTECSAFRWLWKDTAEFNPKGWSLVWQLQQSGSPIVAVQVNETNKTWFFRTRNGSDSGLSIPLGPVQYGHWAYFVACTHLADAPNGWTKIWYRDGGWPDVSSAPTYQRTGHNTWQGETGHNTIGIYAGSDIPSVSYYGYFDRYGRASTPERAVSIAGNP